MEEIIISNYSIIKYLTKNKLEKISFLLSNENIIELINIFYFLNGRKYNI